MLPGGALLGSLLGSSYGKRKYGRGWSSQSGNYYQRRGWGSYGYGRRNYSGRGYYSSPPPRSQFNAKESFSKIFGVEDVKTKKEVTKAYHRYAKTWHPDKFSSASAAHKAMAEEKMRAANDLMDKIRSSGWFEKLAMVMVDRWGEGTEMTKKSFVEEVLKISAKVSPEELLGLARKGGESVKSKVHPKAFMHGSSVFGLNINDDVDIFVPCKSEEEAREVKKDLESRFDLEESKYNDEYIKNNRLVLKGGYVDICLSWEGDEDEYRKKIDRAIDILRKNPEMRRKYLWYKKELENHKGLYKIVKKMIWKRLGLT